MSDFRFEMNFCRRCGSRLHRKDDNRYVCERGHALFLNAAPAAGLLLLNDKSEVLMIVRAIEPGKGLLGLPGGFCDGEETLEAALAREVQEEVGLSPRDYSAPEYLLSGAEPYNYRGEPLPVLIVLYMAKLLTTKQPTAGDDAAAIKWLAPANVSRKQIYSPTIWAALQAVIHRQRA